MSEQELASASCAYRRRFARMKKRTPRRKGVEVSCETQGCILMRSLFSRTHTRDILHVGRVGLTLIRAEWLSARCGGLVDL